MVLFHAFMTSVSNRLSEVISITMLYGADHYSSEFVVFRFILKQKYRSCCFNMKRIDFC